MFLSNTIYQAVIRFKALWLLIFLFLSINFRAVSGNLTSQSISSDTIVSVFREDSLFTTLKEVDITAVGKAPLSKGGSMNFKTEDFYNTLRIMGEADPLNYIKKMAGVTTSGDYGSGVMIDGFESSQSLFRINGVPVLFPYRFGGLFSTFNSSHFSSLDFERNIHRAAMPNRLGAKFDFNNSNSIDSKISGTINVGMLSSSATLRIPISQKFQLNFSGRISYVDLLYGSFFRKSTTLSYQFGDLNLNALWKIDENNTLSLDAFANKDRLEYEDKNYAMDTKLKWGNELASISWRHKGTTTMVNRIYFTGFQNTLNLILPQFSLSTPSSLSLLAAAGDFSNFAGNSSLRIDYGYEANFYIESPQIIETFGYNNDSNPEKHFKYPLEGRIFGDIRVPLHGATALYAGLSASFFHNKSNEGRYNALSLDPRFTLTVPVGFGAFNFHAGRYTQNVHQIGFSQIGLASDFWFAATKEIPAQHSYNFDLDYTGSVSIFSFSITGYFHRVLSQPDYVGQVLNLLDVDYDPANYIFKYNGYNTGFNFVGKFELPNLTANIGTGYGIARRFDKMAQKWIRGTSEPGLTINADVDYRLNSHWQLSARFRFASGRPFTPIVSLYMIAGNVIKEYGLPNSSLFPSTHQLDLSATWSTRSKLKNNLLTHLVNISLINAYGHKNVEIMTYTFDSETGNLKLRKVYSLYRFLPSVSYTIQF